MDQSGYLNIILASYASNFDIYENKMIHGCVISCICIFFFAW